MAKNSPVVSNKEANPRRANAKFKRGFGILAIEKSGLSPIEWGRKFDPLYLVKGKERHRRIKNG